MASHHIHAAPVAALPLALITQAIPKLSRHDLERLTERLIDRLEEIDDDPDVEEDDPGEEDDAPGQSTEDEISTGHFLYGLNGNGPGCVIADPGGCEHDGREEPWR